MTEDDLDGVLDALAEGVLGGEEEEELRGREFEQHAGDLGGECGAEGLDAWEEALAELLVVVRQSLIGAALA